MRAFWVALGSIALASSAMAADLPVKAPALLRAAPVPTWTGFYGGVNIGGGFASNNTTGGQTSYYSQNSGSSSSTGGPSWSDNTDLSGVIGGAQIGYNFQLNPTWVVGFETDFQGSSLKGDLNASQTTGVSLNLNGVYNPATSDVYPVTGTGAETQQIDWYGTVRGRVGVLTGDQTLLVYGTGGLAYGRVRQSFNYTANWLPYAALGFEGTTVSASGATTETKVGWTVGAGLEWRPVTLGNWSVKAEYLYTDLGSTTVVATGTSNLGRILNASNKMDDAFHSVRIGLNYHLN